MQRIRFLLFASILLAVAATARSERNYTIGHQYDFSFGGTNQSGFTAFELQPGLAPFFGFYPSIELQSVGSTNQWTASYRALAERFSGDRKLNSVAQVVAGDFVARAGGRTAYGFNGSFSSAPDYTTVDVLKGSAPPDDFRFVFQPALAESTRRTARGAAHIKYDLSYRSYLTAEGSLLSLRYDQPDQDSDLLLNQMRQEGRIGYWYKLSSRESLDFQYVFVRNDYRQFGTGRTQGIIAGYIREFSPALRMRFEAGPAHVTFDGVDDTGFFASVSLEHHFRTTELSAYYTHSPGDSSGLGSLADLHSLGVSFFAPLWKKLAIGSSFSAFDSRGAVEEGNNYRGFYGSVDLSYPLSRRWFMAWGGSYRRNDYGSSIDQEFKRVYMSLRFRAPDLWRTSL